MKGRAQTEGVWEQGPKGDEVTGEWRKLHSGELHNLYSSSDIIRQIKSRRIRLARHIARMGEGRQLYRVLVGKPEGRRPVGRPRRRWECGIKPGPTYGPVEGCCEFGDEPSGFWRQGVSQSVHTAEKPRLGENDQLISAVLGNSRYLFWYSYKSHKYPLGKIQNFYM
jgi:hypothetical protein